MTNKLYLSQGARDPEWFIVEPRHEEGPLLYQVYSLTAVGRPVVQINLDDGTAQEIEPRLARSRWNDWIINAPVV